MKTSYTIENNKVWINSIDEKTETIMNFKAIYTGESKKECEAWLQGYKKGMRKQNEKQKKDNNNNINSNTNSSRNSNKHHKQKRS